MNLDRVMSVLETVAIAGRAVSPSDLHGMTKLPLPTCYRLLQTLAEHGLLEDREENSRYLIGDRLVRIAHLAKTDADVCAIAAPALKRAAIDYGEAVFLSRFRKNGVAIVHVETPSDPAISYVHPGLGYRPMHACSCSKVIAAFADEAFREMILSGPMKSYTEQTHVTRAALETEFGLIRETGFAECVEEIEVGVSSVAAPVTLKDVGTVFSVGATGPIRRFTPAHRSELGVHLIGLANVVGEAIAFGASSADL